MRRLLQSLFRPLLLPIRRLRLYQLSELKLRPRLLRLLRRLFPLIQLKNKIYIATAGKGPGLALAFFLEIKESCSHEKS